MARSGQVRHERSIDLAEIKRRMQGSITALKHEPAVLRTGRASAALLERVMVEAYGLVHRADHVLVPDLTASARDSGTEIVATWLIGIAWP